jgi:hypothetical protein
MNVTIGTSQTSLANSSTPDTGAHNYYVARWVSPVLNQTSVAANTWTYNFASAESNANANFPCSGTNQPVRVNCYVWKPSNGTKYGTILDGNTGNLFDEPAVTTETAHEGTFTGAAVSSLTANDAVIVFEAWFVLTQAHASAYTQTFYFDGTTENSTENAAVSNHASFISTPENLVFALERVSLSRVYKYNVNSRTSLSRIYKYNIVNRVNSASVKFDGVNDYIDCTNDATLWSQSLTKFSFSFWAYATTGWDGIARRFVGHGASGAFAFSCYLPTATTGQVIFQIRDSTAFAFVSDFDGFTLNAWHHVACTYDNTLGSANLKIYVDGVFGAGNTSPVTEGINSSFSLTLSDSTNDLQGHLRDFRWWTTKTLTQTEITDIYNNSSAAPTPNYWLKIDEGTGNCTDVISGTKTGTLTGGPVWKNNAPAIVAGLTRHYKYNLLSRISLSRIYKWNVLAEELARVSLERIYKWNVNQRLSLSRIYKYNILSRTSLSRIYKHNILSRTSLSRVYKYNVLSRTSLARIYKYNLIGRISLSRIYKYHVQKRVSLARIYKYHVLSRISLSRIYRYHVAVRVSLSRIYKYHVQRRVSLSRIYKYNVLSRRSLSRIYKYNIQSRVSLTRIYKYNIVARVSLVRIYLWNVVVIGLTRISKPQTYKYHLLNRISLSRIYKYNLLTRTSLSRIYKYNVLARLSLLRVYKYNLIGRISRSRIYKYNIQARVSLSRIYRYNIIGRISLARVYKYHVVVRRSLVRVYKYNVIARVSLARVYKWNLLSALARISKQQIYKYHVIQRLSLARVYKYNLLSRVSLPRIYKYHVARRVSLARVYKYNSLARTSLSRIYRYHLLGRLSLARIYRYNMLARISLSRVYKWNVLLGLFRISKEQIYKYNIIGRISKQSRLKWNLATLAVTQWGKVREWIYAKYSETNPSKQ